MLQHMMGARADKACCEVCSACKVVVVGVCLNGGPERAVSSYWSLENRNLVEI